MIGPQHRALAALVQFAPLLGVPLYLWAYATTQNLFVYFFPGLFMLAAGLIVALVTRAVAPPGFVRAQSGGSLRFHAVLAACVVPIFALLFWAFTSGAMGAAQVMVLLFGGLLSVAEVVRAFACAFGALRATAAPLAKS